MEYLILLEKTKTGYSAYSPDVDGCVAAGETKEETIMPVQEALEFHIKGLKKDGDPIPQPSSIA
jgi:predicted RNase H-like HicB family nuclease